MNIIDNVNVEQMYLYLEVGIIFRMFCVLRHRLSQRLELKPIEIPLDPERNDENAQN